jgi:heme/copper-type cytochrome/quinol oxidase subunit 2
MFIRSRIAFSIVIFILSMILFFIVRPRIAFENDGKPRKFGVERNETIYSLGIFTIISAILTFYVFCVIDLIFD